jgi:hypothetical protein
MEQYLKIVLIFSDNIYCISSSFLLSKAQGGGIVQIVSPYRGPIELFNRGYEVKEVVS